ncbi:3-carboxy-cis,cis-mucoante lactonizing enzyme [Physcia stellaris]|nr:3-carboxy-cis,cis-mucoante lactonizing enzyme [Physcia stellaris]
MFVRNVLTTAALVAAASANLLYVSSYAGTISTLNLTKAADNQYHLAQISSTPGCAPNASFITLDSKYHNLYCLNEGIVDANGSLVSFKVDPHEGTLKQVKSLKTPAAPVNSALYNGKNGAQLLAVAHYAWGLTTYKVDSSTGTFELSQTFNITLAKPGPNAARQAASHPHQVLVDPTGQYLLVPDLGADLVRVFHIDPNTFQITQKPSIPVEAGSGPRHGAFQVTHNTTSGVNQVYYYLVTELASTLTSYHVQYLPLNAGLQLQRIKSMKTYADNKDPVFAGTAASEIVISGGQIIVSNRNATLLHIKNPDPKNATQVASDTLATFQSSEPADGNFKFGELTPAGGSFPRQFSLSPKGDLVAVGLQNDKRVAIYSRCTKTGRLGTDILASVDIVGQVTSVVWAAK